MKKSIQNKHNTRTLVFTALFSVLISVCSWISVPSVVPFTMQTFAVFLALCFLGGKNGTLSICLYLLLGTIGLPVFSNGTAGVGILFGKTGGYMLGWIFTGLITWLTEAFISRKIWAQILSLTVGLAVCYAVGTAWFLAVYSVPVGLWTALGWCVFPFILPDLLKLGMALWLSRRLKRILKI